MKILLRHRRIELYYAGPQRWVGDPGEAMDFEEIERASRQKREDSMPDTEVVVSDPDPLSTFSAAPLPLLI